MVDGVVGALLPVDVVPSDLLLVDGVVGPLLLVDGVVGALMLVGVVPDALLLVETIAAHELSCFLLTFVRALLSQGNFFTKYAETMTFPFPSSDKSDSSELVYSNEPMTFCISIFSSVDQGILARIESLLWTF